MIKIFSESIFIEKGINKLHLKRFYSDKNTLGPVLMIHGSIENGRIFYSKNDKGLAPFLAKEGYDVFVADLRGRGESSPKVSEKSDFGLEEILREDFDLYVKKIKEIHGNASISWIGHSWGGVLILAYYAKKHQLVPFRNMIFLASKRRISVFSLKRLYQIDFGWTLFGRMLALFYGYLPSKKYKFGSDDESKRSYLETDKWVKAKKWVDFDGSFNYSEELKKVKLPPILSLTGVNDKVLGHPKDVSKLLEEANAEQSIIKILSKKNGNLEDYDHISIATSKNAENDHFKDILAFMGQS